MSLPPPTGVPRSRFNLSEWALHHRPLVLFLIVVCALAGVYSYGKLGQSEDPPFTFKVMVVRTNWPGATAREVEQQVTDRIERKLQEVPRIDWVRSYSKPGESLVFFALKDNAPPALVPETFYQVRKKVGDMRNTLPAGIQGPFFNDEFGDTYTNIYAITGDGFGYRELKEFGDRVRAELLRVPGVAKVDFIGEQDEKIFIELSNAKLATLGIEPAQIFQTLATQNVVAAAGVFDTPTDRIYLRPTGAFVSLDAIRDLALRANNRVFRLGDIATVERGYVDPPQQRMRFLGREALGIGITMAKGGDVIELGRALDADVARIGAALPVGIDIEPVASMPRAVQRSVNQFVRSLAEAVLIVLAVSLLSLGLRTGPRGRGVDPAGARDHVPRHVDLRHRAAQDLAGRADPVARPARRRRDHRGRDDGDQAGAGVRPLSRRGLRVHEHRVSDADGHADHRRRLPADRDGEERHRRVHALDLRGVVARARRVVVRRGDRDSLPGLPDAAGFHAAARAVALGEAAGPAARAGRAAAARGRPCRPRGRLPDAVLPAVPRAGGVGRRPPRRRDRRDARGVRRFARAVPVRSAAVLSGVLAPRAAGRPAPARGQRLRRDARRDEAARGDPRRASRGSRATSRTSAAAARASICRSTSSCSSRTSRNSSSSRPTTSSGNACARACSPAWTTTSPRCAGASRASRTGRRWGFRSSSGFPARTSRRCARSRARWPP